LNHQLATHNSVGPRKTSFWLLTMTLALWRHLSGFLQWPRLCGDILQWPRLCGDILLHSYNDLSSVETSFCILPMTSTLWRHHFGFLQWPWLYGDIILDFCNDLSFVETSFLTWIFARFLGLLNTSIYWRSSLYWLYDDTTLHLCSSLLKCWLDGDATSYLYSLLIITLSSII